MKRALMVLVGLLLMTSITSAGTIGENFQGGGTAFFGGGNIHYNAGNILNKDSDWTYFNFRLDPGAEFFLADYFSLWSRMEFFYEMNPQSSDTVYKDMDFAVRAGVSQYVVPTPEAQTGIAYDYGISMAFKADPGVDDKVSGVTQKDDSLNYRISLTPHIKFSQFLNERIAVYAQVTTGLALDFEVKDSAGNTVQYDNLLQDRLQLNTNFGFGFSWYVPRAQSALVK